MCTSIVSNISKTVIGWNLDILDMKHTVVAEDDKVFIAVYDEKEGWLPLFGCNSRGDFITMPTCWPYDSKSDPTSPDEINIIPLDIDLLYRRRSFEEIHQLASSQKICSVPGTTFQAQLSDRNGNVLQIIPGQGIVYKEHPRFSVLTNFSPFKGDSEKHPWMRLDRYQTAVQTLEKAESFDVNDCFALLKKVSQTVCPTVVSMVFDIDTNTVYWKDLTVSEEIHQKQFKE